MKEKSKFVYFQIRPFRENDFGVNHWESLLQNISGLKGRISFIVNGNYSSIKLYVKLKDDFQYYFKNVFFSHFPTSDLIQVNGIKTLVDKKTSSFFVREYIHFHKRIDFLSQDDFTKKGKYIDPMKEVISLYSNIENNSELNVFFIYKYIKKTSIFKKIFDLIKNRKNKDEKTEGEQQERTKIHVSIGYYIKTTDKYTASNLRKNILSTFGIFSKNKSLKVKQKPQIKTSDIGRISNFFHMPINDYFFKSLDYTLYKKLGFPSNLPVKLNHKNSEITILGKTDYRGEYKDFGILKEDKFRHIYIVGKTGTGKSTLISNMIKSDMISNNGLALIDPHGDLVETVVEHIPTNRINDVILFDVADTDFPIGFNLLQYETEDEKNRIVSGLVSTFYKLFEHSRGPRLEYVLRNALLSIIEYPNATLIHLLRIFTDAEFRGEVITYVKDPLIKKFWETEFNKRSSQQRDATIGPITNKVGQFLSSSIVRNIFGQPKTKLNLRKIMDEGKIILINLSKGKIGEDNAKMIGSLLVTKFQIEAMSRADIPFEKRKDFYLYIDEFQNFATKSFATILSEARKYRLSLIVANQYTSQLMDEIKDSIFGNVGTIISFTLGNDDAKIISDQFKGIISSNDLISIPRFNAYIKLTINGIISDTFNMKTKPLISPINKEIHIGKIKKQSRQRYSMKRDDLEKLLDIRYNKSFSLKEKVVEKSRLEGLGLTKDEIKNLENIFVKKNIHIFLDYTINEQEADAIIFDTKYYNHKLVWYSMQNKMSDISILKFKKGTIVNVNGKKISINIDIFQHKEWKNPNGKNIDIRIGDKKNILEQIKIGYSDSSNLLFCPNVSKIGLTNKNNSSQLNILQQTTNTNFSIKDIKLNERYDGYVKLIYNYGIFVTVKGVEGLLHKNYIKITGDVSRKKMYNIGDKISVKTIGFKEISEGEKRVVWSQI